jgi:Succinate dehydrogenase/fumarate reductase, flavoprotein subunit
MRERKIEADFCVVGGGMAGLCAAIAAARRGARTVLVNDRPVLGGNASSEVRMWICGAHGENNHETGIIEELLLENAYRNRYPNYSIWDSILYEKARFQEGLELVLNCHVHQADVEGGMIRRVRGIQMTNETLVEIEAGLFSDCTGDGTLGALVGAEFRVGREARGEFGESIAPQEADTRTMGLSCLIQVRETDRQQPFIPPSWAYRYDSDESLPSRDHDLGGDQNFWWLEVGGTSDSIHDAEDLRDELLKIAFGVWDHIKNRGEHGAENWALDWVGFLPGKRESRRFVGDHILTQGDVEARGELFEDVVAYGGWTMDDHFPEGFYHKEAGTIWHPAPSPYAIPYRCLYSRNVGNLFFAGRDISASHCALSSTRVMATCATLGQAVGTAAALASSKGISPRAVYVSHIAQLQQYLMEDDCYLPGKRRRVSELTQRARFSTASRGSQNGAPDTAALLANGYDRQIGKERNSWDGALGDAICVEWNSAVDIDSIRLVFDSDLSRSTHNMRPYYTLAPQDFVVPSQIVKDFRVEVEAGDGTLRTVARGEGNHQRLVRLPLALHTKRLRFVPEATWGSGLSRVFAIDLQ